jgi:hypothetical protein
VKDEHGAVFVAAGDVLTYFTDEWWEAYEFFAMTEVLEAPPFSGGWTSWPAIATQTLFILKSEQNRYESEELKAKAKGSGGHDDRRAKA